MEFRNILVSEVTKAERRRQVDPEKVIDIANSVTQQGLLQPIGVKETDDGYHLIFGAHRLAAFSRLGKKEIPASVFPVSMSDDDCLLAEIQENLARNDLTGAERKAFAAEVGRLSTVLFGESHEGDESQRDSDWFQDWREKSGLPKNTAYTWWKSFCHETARDAAPKQASADDISCFFAWLEGAKIKADAEKAEKERLQDEERRTKAAEAAQRKQDADRDALDALLTKLGNAYGTDVVLEWLYDRIYYWKN